MNLSQKPHNNRLYLAIAIIITLCASLYLLHRYEDVREQQSLDQLAQDLVSDLQQSRRIAMELRKNITLCAVNNETCDPAQHSNWNQGWTIYITQKDEIPFIEPLSRCKRKPTDTANCFLRKKTPAASGENFSLRTTMHYIRFSQDGMLVSSDENAIIEICSNDGTLQDKAVRISKLGHISLLSNHSC